MIPAFVIALREGLEAALIVGLTLGVLARTHQRGYRMAVWIGVASAVAVSLAAAVALNMLGGRLEGVSEQIFEGTTMLLAASVLTWMIFWMQRQSQRYRRGIEREARKAAGSGQSWALFGIAFFAVLREGIETTLFISAARITNSADQTLLGATLGLLAAVSLGWALFASTLRLDIGRFFQVTSLLLILFAAGLWAHAAHEFIEMGWIPGIVEPIWNLNPLLDENSIAGSILRSLFGYNADPSLTEWSAYMAYFVLVAFGLRWSTRKRSALSRAP